MSERLRFAEAVCVGHPDRLADTIAGRIVALVIVCDPEAFVGVEVVLHRNVVFVDGRVAAGREKLFVGEGEIVVFAREAFRDAGYGRTPSNVFPPDPDTLDVRTDLCLKTLAKNERAIRDVSDDQAICVGHAVWGLRADHRIFEQVLANDFAAVFERLRVERSQLGFGSDGKTLVTVRRRRLVNVSLSVQHAQGVDWVATHPRGADGVRGGRGQYVAAGARAPGPEVRLARQRAGAFELGPRATTASRARSSSPGVRHGRPHRRRSDPREGPRKVDPRGQTLARQIALDAVCKKGAREATVWLAYHPGDFTPRWIETVTLPAGAKQTRTTFSMTTPVKRHYLRSKTAEGRLAITAGVSARAGRRA
jgi:S-adenosylmethionine synthetase